MNQHTIIYVMWQKTNETGNTASDLTMLRSCSCIDIPKAQDEFQFLL